MFPYSPHPFEELDGVQKGHRSTDLLTKGGKEKIEFPISPRPQSHLGLGPPKTASPMFQRWSTEVMNSISIRPYSLICATGDPTTEIPSASVHQLPVLNVDENELVRPSSHTTDRVAAWGSCCEQGDNGPNPNPPLILRFVRNVKYSRALLVHSLTLNMNHRK